ncbi:UDP-N-acetylmuramoyl-tripeptide--D-alanyl-D-alanine ligase [Neptunomonas sp. XY-337]|uniref:UDP-N-acetylmuramoyl-tripeptide--D-alanyl-D- alanine ligase n=1 Tax=Neptunomonas sp. XY-337 TaxID=2561897 RepID=UPI0010AB283D|nr:UDP-N-acetylmuramoyl-tripeptide--D-alanyl-D-alanine ligase [Neptunomonas sp. XY-337]
MMRSLSLSELVAPLSARLEGENISVNAVSTDTRSLPQGALFVALRGERFDAHDFADQAVANGAVALVVERLLPLDVPQLVVDDARIALGALGAYNRQLFSGRLYAITGSSGKTTVKEMLAAVMRESGETLATRGNLNNEIGVPLTLLELQPKDEFAVIEMGASGPNEIAYSVGLAKPHLALVNNAMGAHLEGFGSLQGVVTAKGEIYDGLADDGIGVVNIDDPHYADWLTRLGQKRVVTFSQQDTEATYHARDVQLSANGCYRFVFCAPQGEASVELQIMGRHNVSNALAAAALALADGRSLTSVARGLAAFQPVSGRMRLETGVNRCRLVDDSYNANPGSVKAAISMLTELPGERVLVLGDMGELGADAAQLHAQVGAYAAQQGIEHLFTVGELSVHAKMAYEEQRPSGAKHFAGKEQLVEELSQLAHSDMTVLVKGSRSAAMEQVVVNMRAEV